MAKPVRTTPQADLHILELDAWWRANRERAPELFEQELSMALRTISSAPHVGKRYPHAGTEVYRMLMHSTRNHVYYVERDDHVLVVAVCGAIKVTWCARPPRPRVHKLSARPPVDPIKAHRCASVWPHLRLG